MFIPYAAHDHDAYALKVKTAFSKWGDYLLPLIVHQNAVNSLKTTTLRDRRGEYSYIRK